MSGFEEVLNGIKEKVGRGEFVSTTRSDIQDLEFTVQEIVAGELSVEGWIFSASIRSCTIPVTDWQHHLAKAKCRVFSVYQLSNDHLKIVWNNFKVTEDELRRMNGGGSAYMMWKADILTDIKQGRCTRWGRHLFADGLCQWVLELDSNSDVVGCWKTLEGLVSEDRYQEEKLQTSLEYGRQSNDSVHHSVHSSASRLPAEVGYVRQTEMYLNPKTYDLPKLADCYVINRFWKSMQLKIEIQVEDAASEASATPPLCPQCQASGHLHGSMVKKNDAQRASRWRSCTKPFWDFGKP